jgi:two-component system nitrate/nitrite response regulator NarL
MSIRLLIVDDHALVRQGIARILADTPEIEVVGEAVDGDDAISRARELHPDIILMDLFLPNVDGIEATRAIKHELPNVEVIIVTASDSEDDVLQAVTAGAKGYVVKTTDRDELIHHILQAARGEMAISSAVVGKLAASLSRRGDAPQTPDTPSHQQLTDREREVLAQLGIGARNKEIAATLSISNNTVRAHVRSIMHKLEVDNRAQLAAYAVRHDMVADEATDPSHDRRVRFR